MSGDVLCLCSKSEAATHGAIFWLDDLRKLRRAKSKNREHFSPIEPFGMDYDGAEKREKE